MGVGAKKLYLHRLDNSDETLFMSHEKHILKEDGFHMPPGYYLLCELNIPNFFPELKMEDGAKRVKLQICEEETGLYMCVEDSYFAGERWVYNRKPVYNAERNDYDYDSSDDGWSVHINPSAFAEEYHLESYSGVYNVKPVLVDDEAD